ncbi:MAG: GNAT family N-acetyltransferase [Eubacteriales bacterium]|nr:GNAT family N-acetyltransferase [Eubacteriales bacterium]MDD4079129.1 GNAT family N-acetyltransferase [Eubacteriales bacterium]MDD4769073.1 GNAT family N-acetyltransferase [Eubacteriales bacterium]
MLEIVPVSTARDRRAFVDLAWHLYKDDPNWVPPLRTDILNTLDPKHNALLRLGPYCYFLARKDGKIVGRIGCGIDNLLNKAKDKNLGYITLFESIQDYQVAEALFDAAVGFLRRHGADMATGPQSPSNGDDYRGLLVDGFDGPPALLASYNPVWYQEFFEKYGFEKQFDRLGFWFDLDEIPEKLIRGVEIAKKRYKFTVRSVDLDNLESEILAIKHITDKSTPEEWPDMISPSLEEVRAEVKKLIPIAVPELVQIAEAEDGEPIGLAVTLPDYNQVIKRMNGKLFPFGWCKFLYFKNKINTVRLFALMVVPEYHRKGVSAALYKHGMEAAKRRGYIGGDASSIHEFNLKIYNDALGSGGKAYRRFRIYQYKL